MSDDFKKDMAEIREREIFWDGVFQGAGWTFLGFLLLFLAQYFGY